MSIKDALQGILKPEAPLVPRAPAPFKRTLGDIHIALEAQRIYNPALPSIPKAPTPSKPEALGTAANLGTEGRWGKPE